jgi:peptidoglycan/xylan/chitin deacetylase (PgdA/CDA1 family)
MDRRMQRRQFVLSRRTLIAAPAALMASPADANNAAIHWPGGARAAVSLTYDDGLNSQLEHAIPDLEARGLRGTFYLTKDNVAPRIDDWVNVAHHGHEIGNHSVSHLCEVAGSTPKGYYDSEVAPMETWLGEHFGQGARSYAYPCGFVDLGSAWSAAPSTPPAAWTAARTARRTSSTTAAICTPSSRPTSTTTLPPRAPTSTGP